MVYTLDNIVSEWIVENAKSENQRARLYTLGVSCLRELHMDVSGMIKVVQLEINNTQTVDLPNDFLNYRKIGIQGGDGRIHCLGRDNHISLQPICGVDGRNLEDIDYYNTPYGNVPFAGMPYSGAFLGLIDGTDGIFQAGGGNNALGYYRLNRKTNQLWLANLGWMVKCTLIMEYIANITSDGEDFIVHTYAIQTVKKYISWQYVDGDRNTSQTEKAKRRHDYYNELRKYKNRYAASTIEEWMAALRTNSEATTRW